MQTIFVMTGFIKKKQFKDLSKCERNRISRLEQCLILGVVPWDLGWVLPVSVSIRGWQWINFRDLVQLGRRSRGS